jgi:hypothetical protein
MTIIELFQIIVVEPTVKKWEDIVIGVEATIVFVILTAIFALPAWWGIGRRRESKWIEEHGLALLVYFRNIDWRCERIRKAVAQNVIHESSQATLLHADLVKLDADVDGLDRLVTSWSRRAEGMEDWHPYRKDVVKMLEAYEELSVSLQRHIRPLLYYLSMQSDCDGDWAENDRYQVEQYRQYFSGGMDRFWNGGLKKANGDVLDQGDSDPLKKYRNIRLKDRLDKVREHLIGLISKTDIETDKLKIWFTTEDPKATWFSPPGSNQ